MLKIGTIDTTDELLENLGASKLGTPVRLLGGFGTANHLECINDARAFKTIVDGVCNLIFFQAYVTNFADKQWGHVGWSGDSFQVGTKKNGTGVDRQVEFLMGGTVVAGLGINGRAFFTNGLELQQVASPPTPDAGKVAIIVEESGGKLRVVAKYPDGSIDPISIQP